MTDLEFEDGSRVTTTEDHPFWSITDGRFERADELSAGEEVRTDTGRRVKVKGLDYASSYVGTAYNLTVEGIHTYYVLAGEYPILTHNVSCDFIPGDIPLAGEIDRGSLTKLREKQLEKALGSVGEDAHGFKEDWVGKNVSRFDAMRDGDGRIILVSKDGKILVPTNYRYVP